MCLEYEEAKARLFRCSRRRVQVQLDLTDPATLLIDGLLCLYEWYSELATAEGELQPMLPIDQSIFSIGWNYSVPPIPTCIIVVGRVTGTGEAWTGRA